MSIVILTNSKNGCRYAYESEAIYSKEHHQARPKRKYLGKVDENGNIIYSSHKRGGARTKSPQTLAAEDQKRAAALLADENSKDTEFRELYLHAEQARKDAVTRVQTLEAENKEWKKRYKKLERLMNSIHSMSEIESGTRTESKAENENT